MTGKASTAQSSMTNDEFVLSGVRVMPMKLNFLIIIRKIV